MSSYAFGKSNQGILRSEVFQLQARPFHLLITGRQGKSGCGQGCFQEISSTYLIGGESENGAFHLIEAHRKARISELNMKLTQAQNQLEMEKERGEELDILRKASQSQNWWESPIQELSFAQLEQLKASLLTLKQKLARQAQQILLQNSVPPQPFFSPNPGPPGNLPFDTSNTGFDSNMAVDPFSSNTTMTAFNTDMTGTPFNQSSTTMTPYGYNLGYGNGFF
ncbi:hypothetical protein POTOM_028682 [Populus tomentosa]|uniref:Agamous-like MADS-box protein AGL62 n=1 Tax=Populus tomentosa TaxID=118781 RepID=A0A8X7ZGZ8_POPTO|nr:hypothetical protein POTOM_028682 [Populus tomentosa]